MLEQNIFPFAGIVGQEKMKLALLLNIVDPKIGGVLILGERGTGKTTTIRSLVNLLPEICVLSNDPFNSDALSSEFKSIEKIKVPMVELPLGATIDRVCGTINLKEVISGNGNSFEPGLLARANRGVLYVDEINLLDDHLVDVLLDAAASGWNIVEREGISIKHRASFILIGSGNKEEGELRPQLLDRFGMFVEIGTIQDPIVRSKVVEERLVFDLFPESIYKKYEESQIYEKKRILDAKAILQKVTLKEEYQFIISQLCGELKIEGLRGDIVVTRAAKAFAALNLRSEVTLEDINIILDFCLRHRLRVDPMDTISSADKIEKIFKKYVN